MSSWLVRYLKNVFLSLVSACALPWLIDDLCLAKPLPSSITKSESAGAGVETEAPERTIGPSEYYVDCEVADSQGDGRSPMKAWHRLDQVNAHTFVPGDAIYLKRGTTCHGSLWPKGSGSSSAIIRLSAYGNGVRPAVIAGKADEEAFKLSDQEYWEVDSIDFSGGTLFGVFVSGQTGILHHIHLRNLVVHDVRGGEVKHKESGLVVISPGKVQQHFDDILVEGVTAYDTDQWAGILVGGGNFGEVAEENWSTHVIIRNSIVHDVYGDGIILFRVKDGLIDTSAAWRTGMQTTQSIGTPNAIWTWMCQDCVVSRNEAFLTDSPGVDGGAFDIDYGNTRNSVLNNYGHDTQGYCIAVFGAGYVTRESLVEGNLCIDNGKSPRLAQYQGAIFLYTWNNGVIENLRIEENSIYWSPPGNFPAVLNNADIQGSQRIFRENQIYSASPSVIVSNKNLAFQENRYTTCGTHGATWTFENHTYKTLDEYRLASGQEKGSTWKPDMPSVACRHAVRSTSQEANVSAQAQATKNATAAHGTPLPGWTVVSELPVNLDASGLPDAASAGQLVVLRNLSLQFRPSGLRTKVTLNLTHPSSDESVANVIRDFAMSAIDASRSTSRGSPTRPTICLVAPDGSIAKEWHDFVGPVELGKAVRDLLGEPHYSQIDSEAK
jgi:hypothetical protein